MRETHIQNEYVRTQVKWRFTPPAYKKINAKLCQLGVFFSRAA
jgi:hypothetical protein